MQRYIFSVAAKALTAEFMLIGCYADMGFNCPRRIGRLPQKLTKIAIEIGHPLMKSRNSS